MKNLKLVTSLHRKVEEAADSQCIDINFDSGTIYCATERQLIELDPVSGTVSGKLDLADVADLKPESRFISIKHLPEEFSVCAATNTGDLLLWNVMSYEVECVGSVESGFTAMEWSPEQELLILTTGAKSFIMMTREFDPVTEQSLHPDKSGEAEFVQVGWGKKETQFHGSVGKQAAFVKPEEVKPAMAWDDRKPRITWKADGQFFAISSIQPDNGARKMYTWTREGVHHSTSENVDGIEQSLSWRPSGNLIATSQRRPNKHDIAFFERNGLRHGEFTLPFSVNQVKVREVYWNNDSSVLAVWCEDIEGENTKSYVQLWTTGNYHWYLKQSLHFDGPEQSICAIMWDPEHEYRLHIVCKNGGYFQYTWAWFSTYSIGRSSEDQAIVAVIDGANVLMTPMRHMVVPPPMSAYQLQLPAAVNQVFFALPPYSNNVALLLVDNKVAVFKFNKEGGAPGSEVKVNAAGGNGFKSCCKFPTLQGIYNIKGLDKELQYPLSVSHVSWISEKELLFTTVTSSASPHSVIHRATIDDEKIQVTGSTSVESRIFNTAFNGDINCLAVQLVDGTLLKYSVDDDMLLPWETADGMDAQFPAPCTQMALCNIGGEMCVLGLTHRYRFYVNNMEVASNCTSFSVHDEFLLLTTLSHTCRCISLHTKVKDLPTLSDGKAHPFDESVRRVERGSQIVISVADDTKLILQMPRGNLETVHPRALVLTAVRKHLDRLQFLEAFTLMRKHRINMNLLYDHNPTMFLDNIKLFVQQVAAVNHINLFLTDLLEEDVTVTMYTAVYERNKTAVPDVIAPDTGPGQTGNKVDKICDAVREALDSLDRNKYLLSIITSYVRKSRPELEQALQLVKNLRDCENDLPHISAEEALKYLLFLVDVNELYDIALGTYDFDLVLMVAEKSQKDPKEYIPFLNQLRKLETNYQRYTIDRHLKRYKQALQNIVKCGPEHFSECLSLVNEHKLHTTALQLYPAVSDQYKEIASCYGDILSDKRQHEEAGLMFVKGENWECALTSFIACHQWQQVFCMTSQLKYSSEMEAETARRVADDLKTRGRHSEAAIVLEQYAKDSEEAIVTLIQGCLWDEAIRMMHRYSRLDFLETDLKPHLLESYDGHVTNLEQMKDNFEKHRARLVVVRQEKEKARLELIETGGIANVHDSDLFSDTSSATGESVQSSRYSGETTSSVYSKMSGRSIKNRRKAEHKKWRLKEGSEFEDFALIAALAKIIKLVDGLREEMRALVRVLVMFHFDRQAEQIQRQYDTILTLIDKAIPQIWLDEDKDEEFKPVLGPNATANTIALAMQQGRNVQSTDSQEKLDPVIKFAPVLQKEVKWKLYALET